jgi:hypothetical protein
MTDIACIANIGPRERRKRLVGGILGITGATIIAVIMFARGTPRAWRAILFLPLWVGALGFTQAREHTCVALAARDVQNLDTGEEPVAADATRQIRAQARRVLAQSVVAALALTVALIALG